MNRYGKISNWLSDFAEGSLRKVEASYFNKLKEMIEQGSNKKFATIDEALSDFASRLSLTHEKTASLKTTLQTVAFQKDDIDKQVSNGVPAEAIANEHGSTDEEKKIILDYVKSQEGAEKERRSEVVRDIGREVDVKAPGSVALSPRNSSFKKKAVEYTSVENWRHKLPEEPSGSAGAGWAEKMYDRASRFVKIDFESGLPMVTIFNTKTMNLTSNEALEVLYRDLKVALLSDVGSVMIEKYTERFDRETVSELQNEEAEIAKGKMLNEAEDLIRKILLSDPDKRGYVKDEDEAISLLKQLLDFTEGEMASLLEQARVFVLQIKATEDEDLKVTLKGQLEEVLEEIQKAKKPIADKMKSLIVFPTGSEKDSEGKRKGRLTHNIYYSMFDKKRRIEFLKILMSQVVSTPYSGSMSQGSKIMQSAVFYAKDIWPFLNQQADVNEGLYVGMPTVRAKSPNGENNIPNPNYGQNIDMSKYKFPIGTIAKAQEKLKVQILQIVKDAIMKDEPLASYFQPSSSGPVEQPFRISDIENEEFKGKMLDLTDPANLKTIDVEQRTKWKPTIPEEKRKKSIFNSFRPFSSRMAAVVGDVVFIDSEGKEYSTMEALLEANVSDIEKANLEDMLSRVDDMLMKDFASEEVPEEEFALAAELYGRIQKIAKEIGGKEGLQLSRIASILEEEPTESYKYRKALARFTAIFSTKFIPGGLLIRFYMRVPFVANLGSGTHKGLQETFLALKNLHPDWDDAKIHKAIQNYLIEVPAAYSYSTRSKSDIKQSPIKVFEKGLALPQFEEMKDLSQVKEFLLKLLHNGVFDPILKVDIGGKAVDPNSEKGKVNLAELEARLIAVEKGEEVYYPPERDSVADSGAEKGGIFKLPDIETYAGRSLSLVKMASEENWWYVDAMDMAIIGPFGSLDAVVADQDTKAGINNKIEEKEYAMASLSIKALKRLAECADKLDAKGEIELARQVDGIIAQASEEYGVTPSYDAVKEFHPVGGSTTQLDNKVKDDGAKIETITEQQKKDLEVVQSTPTGIQACKKCGLTHIAAIIEICPSCNTRI